MDWVNAYFIGLGATLASIIIVTFRRGIDLWGGLGWMLLDAAIWPLYWPYTIIRELRRRRRLRPFRRPA